MRVQVLCAGVVGCCAGLMVTLMAQNAPPKLDLVGDRFKPLTYEQMTAEQKALTDHIISGPRASMGGPFNALLRSPELGDLAQQLGAYVRFRSSLPRHLNEMAIIMTARVWTAQYEWYVHKQAALTAGLNPAIVAAIAENKRPASMKPDEQALYEFTRELLDTKHVSDATFQNAIKAFGEKGVVDLIGLTGYYGMVSALLNVDRYPLPAGVKPELGALR
jgi:4-carboxymuconolactone decarboxylase